ncbi:MAG: enoyl-CoA hydratase/isomerase family protein [Ectothiorhodospiraceae bacterium]|nr:enoyl-CoA hydratase/isomerase family protein [Ectothiorhodospiraceae bacterium]
MRYSRYEAIRVEKQDRVVTLTFNRPEVLNAVDEQLHEELAQIFTDVAADPECDIVVLTGAGRAFSAGGDIGWMQKMIDEPEAFEKTAMEAKRIIFSMLDCEKPVIAKVNGHAAGLGATIALFSDVIFAAEDARIGDPHVSVGFVAGDGGAVIWPQLVGYARAKEFLMTGEMLKAKRAEDMGLINYAVPSDELDARVDQFVQQLLAGATKAIRWTKVSANIGLKQLAHSIMDACISMEAQSNVTADHQEAVNAFREKRQPVFTGK